MNLVHRERVPLETADVGAELLDILSRGLYTDPFDAVREYVQNAVDAGASEIIITHTGAALQIRDDGFGMGWEELKNARRFGVSIKDATKDIGFRGIGIYSSYGIAGKLRFLSRKTLSNEQLGMEIDFASIKQKLDRSRQTPGRRAAIPLADVLYDHSEFTRAAYAGRMDDPAFTLVALEEIDPTFREKLADRDQLKDYLLRTVHVKFTEANHGIEVNRLLQDHLNITGVSIKLRFHGHLELTLERQMPSHAVSSPETHWLYNDITGERIAFVWHSLTEGNNTLPIAENGFALKLKSFTIGSRSLLKVPLWPRTGGGVLYGWYFGEVHILDSANIVPNAARNALEPGSQTAYLESVLRSYFSNIHKHADDVRRYRSALEKYSILCPRIDELELRTQELNANPAELYSDSIKIKDEISLAMKNVAKGKALGANSLLIQLKEVLKRVDKIESGAKKAAGRVSAQQTSMPVRNPLRKSPIERKTTQTVPPLSVYLIDTMAVAKTSMDKRVLEEFNDIFRRLESAANEELPQRFMLLLDELFANEVSLPSRVEEARRMLRERFNLDADGPVSLLAALAKAGFEPANEREIAIMHHIDEALLEASGGRELPYYRLLQAIANHDFESDIPLA